MTIRVGDGPFYPFHDGEHPLYHYQVTTTNKPPSLQSSSVTIPLPEFGAMLEVIQAVRGRKLLRGRRRLRDAVQEYDRVAPKDSDV